MRRLILLWAVVCLLLVSTALCRTWYVKNDGTGDVPTIQVGLDTAAVGDSVLVAAGTYYVNLYMKAGLFLTSEMGPASTVLDGGSVGEVILCDSLGNDPYTEISGFTIQHGEALVHAGVVDSPIGGGICCLWTSALIRDCRFFRNHSSNNGGGIGCIYSPLTVEDCSFVENVTRYHGGGISCCYSGSVIRDCVFDRNEAGYGAGVSFYWCSGAELSNCQFTGGMGVTAGGGMHCWGSDASVSECIFYSNFTDGRGAALWVGDLDGTLWPSITRCTVIDNECRGSVYGAIHVWHSPFDPGGGLIEFRNIIVADNDAIGVYSEESEPTVRMLCCDVWGNQFGSYGGYCADPGDTDGNFSLDPLFCDPEINDYTVEECSPCIPGNHPYGYTCGDIIGALGEGCPCSGVATIPTTWGAIKSTYR